MNNTNITRLLHKDILIKHRNTNDFTGSSIRLLDDENKSDLMYFEVLQVSPDVTEIEVGDVVILPWPNVMMPFLLNGERVTITSEDEVWAVLKE